MDEFNAGLTLMNMLHAGSHAEWQKDLRDAERYDPFMFQAWQRDQRQPRATPQSNGREPRDKEDGSPVSDSATQSEGSSASTILLVEDKNEDIDEWMTEDEAANLRADGTEGHKLSNPGQVDEGTQEGTKLVNPAARAAKKRPKKSAKKARPRKRKQKGKA